MFEETLKGMIQEARQMGKRKEEERLTGDEVGAMGGDPQPQVEVGKIMILDHIISDL